MPQVGFTILIKHLQYNKDDPLENEKSRKILPITTATLKNSPSLYETSTLLKLGENLGV